MFGRIAIFRGGFAGAGLSSRQHPVSQRRKPTEVSGSSAAVAVRNSQVSELPEQILKGTQCLK